ncbi:hypothetical protein MA16_Dca001539 [Dendrobium catenatum]|uniref:Uncharacterized protein n=1 Tax=Dendrobium catenatum TaxID=906689 RepID=A0A2I0WMQ5_9ASPA|nr:hypothetical protein MA16_Dca001539 [Dendrobium catenatum]
MKSTFLPSSVLWGGLRPLCAPFEGVSAGTGRRLALKHHRSREKRFGEPMFAPTESREEQYLPSFS